jgi:nitrous oxide reductase accessory protein NosL
MKRIIGLAVIVAALVAGCGDTADKNEYVTKVNNAQAALTTSMAKINPAGDPASIATELDEGAKAIEKTATDFKAIAPPDDAKGAHDKMVNGLSALADTFRDAAEAARDKDTEKMVQLLSGIQTSEGAKQLEAAQKELTENGYKFKDA